MYNFRKSPKEITPGLICVAKDAESYARVKVLKIINLHANNKKPRAVKLQSIDDGAIRECVNVSFFFS